MSKAPIRVRDIMTKNVISLAASTTVQDAARSLTFHHVSGAPIVNRGKVVGVVSKSDLVNPRNRATTAEPLNVNQVMSPAPYAVRPGDWAMTAVRLMVEQTVHRVVVVDGRGKLVGIVSAMDVLAALMRGEKVEAGEGPPDDDEPEAKIAPGPIDLRDLELPE